MRYRFGRFVLSPARRLLWRDGQEIALIPRYFDLLLLLIERRHQAAGQRPDRSGEDLHGAARAPKIRPMLVTEVT